MNSAILNSSSWEKLKQLKPSVEFGVPANDSTSDYFQYALEGGTAFTEESK